MLERIKADKFSAPVVLGLGVTVLFFGALLAWGCFAPLGSAVITEGRLDVSSNRKTLDHVDGGTISELLVEEGASVAVGQLLLRLDTSELTTKRQVLSRRRDILLARRARLQAEQQGGEKIKFPREIEQRAQTDEQLRRMLASQRTLFRADRSATAGELDILENRLVQIREQIVGIKGQIEALKERHALLTFDLRQKADLFTRQLTTREQVSALRERAARLAGEIAERRSALAQAKVTIGETKLKIIQNRQERIVKVAGEQRKLGDELLELVPQLSGVHKKLRRTDLRAPASGIVIGLSKFTVGGVVRAGEPILDIVPNADELIIKAKIDPADADVTKVGMPAVVRLSAFSMRRLDPLNGLLTRLAPDATVDEVTKKPHYVGIIKLNAGDLDNIPVPLKAGMPVEVVLPIAERTALDYLIDPLFSHLRRAMSEH